MHKIIALSVIEPYKIRITFADSTIKTIDFENFLAKGIALELRNFEKFKQVKIDSAGGLLWANGLDFCPNFLRELEHIESEYAA